MWMSWRRQSRLCTHSSAYMDEDDWLGCVIRPNTDSNSDMLMDSTHIRRAKTAFEALWGFGRPL